MRVTLPAAAGAPVVGGALLASACGSSSKSSSSPTSSAVSQPALQAGQDSFGLVTTQVVVSALNERMTQVRRFKSSCTYSNSAGTNNVSISTAKTTRAGAEAVVTSATRTAKVKVAYLSGVGDSAIAYLRQGKSVGIATGLVAKDGTLVLLQVSGPKASKLLPRAIALTKVAASRTP